MKSYKKDLDNQFKGKIKELNDLANDQAKYNNLISNLISKMNLDENFENEDKKDDENKNEKPKNSENQEQKTEKQKEEKQEMSIEAGIPDLENQTKESDKDVEDIQIEDKSNPDFKKKK